MVYIGASVVVYAFVLEVAGAIGRGHPTAKPVVCLRHVILRLNFIFHFGTLVGAMAPLLVIRVGE